MAAQPFLLWCYLRDLYVKCWNHATVTVYSGKSSPSKFRRTWSVCTSSQPRWLAPASQNSMSPADNLIQKYNPAFRHIAQPQMSSRLAAATGILQSQSQSATHLQCTIGPALPPVCCTHLTWTPKWKRTQQSECSRCRQGQVN